MREPQAPPNKPMQRTTFGPPLIGKALDNQVMDTRYLRKGDRMDRNHQQ